MALPNNNINPGRPPLLWSEVNEAFKQINENFDSVAATLSGGGGGLSPINFETLDTSVSPTDDNTYALGSNSKRWKYLYASEYSDVPGEEFNGVWLGTAHIQGVSGTVNLPANSTVGGNLLIDPDKTFFKEVQVDDGESIIATDFGSALKITSGTAINVTVDSGAESLIIDNTGVTSLAGSTYIGVDVSTGNVTITNLGVTTVAAGAAVSGRSAGAGISVSGATGNVTITNTGILTVDSGSPGFITVSTDDPTGVATVSFNSGAVATAAFRYVVVDGDNIDFIEADNVADTLNLISGAGINITKVPGTDTITFNVNTNLDINGSVFADDSTVIVDATENKIYASGGFFGDVTGNVTGNTTGYHTGDMTGSVFADDSTKLVDAVEGLIVGAVVAPSVSVNGTFNITTTGAFNQLVNIQIPSGGSLGINQDTAPVYFNGSGEDKIVTIQDGNITANTIFVPIIDTTDSSAISVVPPVNFQTTISTDQGIQLNGVDAIIRSDDNIRLVPTNSVESIGAELTITGLDVMGEPYVIIETPTGQGTIQIGGDNNNTASVTVRKSTGEVYVGGFWRFLADGGLYSGYLYAPPDSPTAGAFYVADGATWDPASKSGAVPYPVFYDGASYHALY